LKIGVLPIWVIKNRKNIKKNWSKKCKICISTSGLTPWWAPLSFHANLLCCFFLCDMLCLPSRVYPWEEAQVQLLRHLTQSRDGGLNFVQNFLNLYRPHLLSNWAENWCASNLSDAESKKISKTTSKKCRIWISISGLTPWLAPFTFRVDRAMRFLSFWSAMPSCQVCP
jgi:hypothetical protein